MKQRSSWCLVLCWCLAGTLSADELQQRLGALAAAPHDVLHYRETRVSGLLPDPVVYRGRLEYDAKTGQLTKQVDEPHPARLSITATHLEAQVGNGKTRRLALDRRPELSALLTGLRALLTGDQSLIESAFEAEYQESGDDWNLRLVPRDAGAANKLTALEIHGHANRLTRIDTLLADQPRQRMEILDERRESGPLADAPDR